MLFEERQIHWKILIGQQRLGSEFQLAQKSHPKKTNRRIFRRSLPSFLDTPQASQSHPAIPKKDSGRHFSIFAKDRLIHYVVLSETEPVPHLARFRTFPQTAVTSRQRLLIHSSQYR